MNTFKAVLKGIGFVWLMVCVLGVLVVPLCILMYFSMKTQSALYIIPTVVYGITLVGGAAGYSAWS